MFFQCRPKIRNFEYLVEYYTQVMHELKHKDSASVHKNLKQIQDNLLETMPDLDKRSFKDDAFTVLKAFFAGLIF